MIKYVVHGVNETLAMTYHVETSQLTIGGNKRFIGLMEAMMEDYFVVHTDCEPVQTAANKVKFVEHVSREVFENGIQELKEAGYLFELVKKIDRLIY